MSSDQSGEPPQLQEEEEEAGPGPETGGKDEASLGGEGGSSGMVSERPSVAWKLTKRLTRPVLCGDKGARYDPPHPLGKRSTLMEQRHISRYSFSLSRHLRDRCLTVITIITLK